MPRPGAVLQVDGLGFAHPKQPALFANWSLAITPGVTWLGGDESTGKTTLLRLLAGELSAQQGSLRLNGVALAEQPAAYRSQVAWADPRTQAFDELTPHAVWERLRSQHPTWNATLLADLIDGLALESHLAKSLTMLSTGTRRKVFLAGTLASGAALTLLDEPLPHWTRPPSTCCWSCCMRSPRIPAGPGWWRTTWRRVGWGWRGWSSWGCRPGMDRSPAFWVESLRTGFETKRSSAIINSSPQS